jgi:YihY family inner membrane protein
MRDSPAVRVRWHLTHPLPLLKQLVLRTESHAYSAGLAFFALVGFYPFCLLLLWVSGDLLHWSAGDTVIRETLREYYPQGKDFLIRNLDASVVQHRDELSFASAIWIVVGAAGIFVPLETALNTLWGVREHRPYWRNQLVGFLLTTAGVALAFLFVLLTAALEQLVSGVHPRMLENAVSYGVLRGTALALAIVAIFLLYRYLPNRSVTAREVLPAAIAAGVVAEAVRYVYLLALPHLDLSKSQGPYHVSVSFALLAYFEAFVLMGGAFIAARPPGGEAESSEPAAS